MVYEKDTPPLRCYILLENLPISDNKADGQHKKEGTKKQNNTGEKKNSSKNGLLHYSF